MNTVNTTLLRNKLADVIREVAKKQKYMLVAKRGKITSALVDIEFFEDLLALSNKKYLASIKKARKEYEKGNILTHQEVFSDV